MYKIIFAIMFSSNLAFAGTVCLVNKDHADCDTYQTMKECLVDAAKINGLCTPKQSIYGSNNQYCRITNEQTGSKQCLYSTLKDCQAEALNFGSRCVKNN